MDVSKEDLAMELRQWLGGKVVQYSCIPASERIEGSVSRFVKFGKPPLQSDLILWLLSRSQLHITSEGQAELIFGGKSIHRGDNSNAGLDSSTVPNAFPNTVRVASLREALDTDAKGRIRETMLHSSQSITDEFLHLNDKNGTARAVGYVDDLGMYEATNQILGKSAALSLAMHEKIKKRPDAKPVVSTIRWASSNAQLVADLKSARKKIEQSMDVRRQVPSNDSS